MSLYIIPPECNIQFIEMETEIYIDFVLHYNIDMQCFKQNKMSDSIIRF